MIAYVVAITVRTRAGARERGILAALAAFGRRRSGRRRGLALPVPPAARPAPRLLLRRRLRRGAVDRLRVRRFGLRFRGSLGLGCGSLDRLGLVAVRAQVVGRDVDRGLLALAAAACSAPRLLLRRSGRPVGLAGRLGIDGLGIDGLGIEGLGLRRRRGGLARRLARWLLGLAFGRDRRGAVLRSAVER